MSTQPNIPNSQAGTSGIIGSGNNGGAWPLEDQITSLTAQALNGNTTRNRHLALVQLLSKLNAQDSDGKTADLVNIARDASIKHAIGLTDVIANLLTNTPERERNEADDPDVLPIKTADSVACPIYVQHAQDRNDPPDVSIETIAEHMAHYPEWETALLTRRANFGERDPFDIKNRACSIVDDSDTYSKATRDRVDALYNGGANDLDALTAAVIEAEREAGKLPKPRTARAANADHVGRIEFADETEETSDEVLELRERVAELEAEVDLWKRQEWDIKHSQPSGRPGRRRGESEFDEILDELQITVMVEHIGQNTTGPGCAGSILLLIEHLGGLAFRKQFNELDMAIDRIRDGLLAGDYMKEHGAESLRELAHDYAHDWIEYHVTSGIKNLSDDFERYNDKRKRAKYANR